MEQLKKKKPVGLTNPIHFFCDLELLTNPIAVKDC
jgi:hypothetical protein